MSKALSIYSQELWVSQSLRDVNLIFFLRFWSEEVSEEETSEVHKKVISKSKISVNCRKQNSDLAKLK